MSDAEARGPSAKKAGESVSAGALPRTEEQTTANAGESSPPEISSVFDEVEAFYDDIWRKNTSSSTVESIPPSSGASIELIPDDRAPVNTLDRAPGDMPSDL
jgi:hypothetical protein